MRILKMILYIILVLLVLVVIWVKLPFGRLNTTYKNDINRLNAVNIKYSEKDVFKEEEFSRFPNAIREFIKRSGYIGKRKMNSFFMKFNNADFIMAQNGENKNLKIRYTLHDFISLDRIAKIDTNMMFIPFEGYDYFIDNIGGMRGDLLKLITIFNVRGKEMDEACLNTVLAEILFMPSALLDNDIKFNEIDDKKIEVTLVKNGLKANGIMNFNDKYEFTSFTTNNRKRADANGKYENIPWTSKCLDYKVNKDGLNLPSRVQGIWNEQEKDLIYFDGIIDEFIFQ